MLAERRGADATTDRHEVVRGLRVLALVDAGDLDVVGVHLVGGLVGTLGIGFLASASAPAGVDGLFYGGGLDQLWRQAIGAVAVLVFSFVVTTVIGLVIQRTMGFRLETDHEVAGIDLREHAETGYDINGVTGGRFGAGLPAGHPGPAQPGHPVRTHEGASA